MTATVNLAPLAKLRFVDNNGVPLAGGKVFTYAAGSTTKQATYTDASGATPNPNPVMLDSRGEAAIWFDQTLAYKVTLAPSTDTDPPTSPIWTIDGIPANLAQVMLTNLASTTNSANGAGMVGFNPTLNYATGTIGKHAGVEWNPQDYPWLAKFDGATDDTSAIQACLTAIIAAGGGTMRLPRGTAIVSGLSISPNFGRLTGGLVIVGCGKNRTTLQQTGTPASGLFYISGNTPGVGTPNSLQLVMKDFSLLGTGKTADGFVLDGIASFNLDGIAAEAFNRGLYLHSSLIGIVKNCSFSGNTTGVFTRLNGTSAYNNHVLFESNIVGGNSKYGFDFGSANNITLKQNDIEANGVAAPTSAVTFSGTTVTWTGHGLLSFDPVVFTSSGALPSGLVANRQYYVGTVIDANSFQIAATVGGSAVNTGTGGSGTHTGLSFNSGAIVIRNTCISEFGAASFQLQENWFESGLGAAIRSEWMSSAFGLKITIEGGSILGTAGGYTSLAIGNVAFLSIRDLWAVSGSDTAYINADNLLIENSYFINLYKPDMIAKQSGGSGFSHYRNCWINGLHHIDGEVVNFTATATGLTTSPTCTIAANIQGNHVRLLVNPCQGTSNATTYTLTGMPTQLVPRVQTGLIGHCTDNGVNAISYFFVSTAGVLNFFFGAGSGFTASGTKGVGNNFAVEYDI